MNMISTNIKIFNGNKWETVRERWNTYLNSNQFSSVAQPYQTLCNLMDWSMPGFPVHHKLPELAQTHVHRVGDAIQLSHLLLSPFPPAFSLSQHQNLFQRVSLSHQVTKALELQLQHQSFQWIFRSESFRIDWFDLLAVQRTLKSLFQHHNSKTSILRCSAFFMVQVSLMYLTTGKTIALIIWMFVRKVMSLLFSMLARFVIAFLPRSKHLLISWLQWFHHLQWFWSPQNKVCHCFHCFPIYLPWNDGTRCHDLSFLNIEL